MGISQIFDNRAVCIVIDFDGTEWYSVRKGEKQPLSIGGDKCENAISKREEVFKYMDLRAVRALGDGTLIDRHGHKLSGASKMTYIVYRFDKMLSGIDPERIKQGQDWVLQHKDVRSKNLIAQYT